MAPLDIAAHSLLIRRGHDLVLLLPNPSLTPYWLQVRLDHSPLVVYRFDPVRHPLSADSLHTTLRRSEASSYARRFRGALPPFPPLTNTPASPTQIPRSTTSAASGVRHKSLGQPCQLRNQGVTALPSRQCTTPIAVAGPVGNCAR